MHSVELKFVDCSKGFVFFVDQLIQPFLRISWTGIK
jgi:hypothetical protein